MQWNLRHVFFRVLNIGQCMWRAFWCHASCWVHGGMALPRYDNWRHFSPEEPWISNVFFVHGSKNAWDISFLKEKIRKNHSSLSSKLIQTREWPEITGWCFFPRNLREPKKIHTENRCSFFGRPDVITYSSMINGYAKVWLGLEVWIGGGTGSLSGWI